MKKLAFLMMVIGVAAIFWSIDEVGAQDKSPVVLDENIYRLQSTTLYEDQYLSLDLPNEESDDDEDDVQLFQTNNTNNQKWRIFKDHTRKGMYCIQSFLGAPNTDEKYLGVDDDEVGEEVEFQRKDGTSRQAWVFEKISTDPQDDRFRVKNDATGGYLYHGENSPEEEVTTEKSDDPNTIWRIIVSPVK